MTRIAFEQGSEDSAQQEPLRSREEMITANLPLVHFVLGRMSDLTGYATLDREDAFAHGVEGLIQAVDNYDPTRGTTFASYAMLRIRGAILDAVRRLDIMPRSARQAARRVEAASLELANQLGRWPTMKELAEHTGLSIAELKRSSSQMGSPTSSLDRLMGSDSEDGAGWEVEDRTEYCDPAEATDHQVELGLLGDALSALSPRDRAIIDMRYRQSMSFLEIAQRMSLSESRVCQLHRRAVTRLRQAHYSLLAA